MRRAAVLLLALAACDPIDTVVARIPDGGMLMHGPTCTESSECHMDEFCQKSACNAATGNCSHKPACMDNHYEPVCGCNGVTYWNDCLRQLDGAAAVVPNEMECSAPASCDSASDCTQGPFGACARLVVSNNSCPATVDGVCWVVPPNCPAGQLSNWEPCSGGACMDLCGAIRSQQPAIQKASCP